MSSHFDLSLFQNPVGFEPGSRENRQKPGFPTKFKEAVPKTEVLEQPHLPVFLEFLPLTLFLANDIVQKGRVKLDSMRFWSVYDQDRGFQRFCRQVQTFDSKEPSFDKNGSK
jgi:hypothetical protein